MAGEEPEGAFPFRADQLLVQLVAAVDLIRNYPEAGTWWIGNLMVDPAWRGQGFGARLYRACEDWIGSQGASKIGLCVQEQNPGAYSFWSRMGYRQTQQVKQRIGSLESTVGIMYRELAAQPGVAADSQPE